MVGGERGEVLLLPATTPKWTLPKEHEEVECVIALPRFLFGGFDAGKEVGNLIYRLNGIEIGRISLVTAEAVAAEEPLSLWARFKRIFSK